MILPSPSLAHNPPPPPDSLSMIIPLPPRYHQHDPFYPHPDPFRPRPPQHDLTPFPKIHVYPQTILSKPLNPDSLSTIFSIPVPSRSPQHDSLFQVPSRSNKHDPPYPSLIQIPSVRSSLSQSHPDPISKILPMYPSPIQIPSA